MIILITGASHTGKTLISQKLLEKLNYPYLSIDLLKMGLIKSKLTNLTPEDDEELKQFLWPIISQIIITAIENNQNLIVEGDYIPFNWKNSFSNEQLKQIKHFCLIMSENYISNNFEKIIKFENLIEKRKFDCFNKDELTKHNLNNLYMCKKTKSNYILIDKNYSITKIVNQILKEISN